MYGISDAIKLAVFTLQYACVLIGALIAVQLVVIAGGTGIALSDQTPTALEHNETRWSGRGTAHLLSPPSNVQGADRPTLRLPVGHGS